MSTAPADKQTTTPAVCGDVWGTHCRHLVYGPGWSHDDHPSAFDRLATASQATANTAALTALATCNDLQVLRRLVRNPSCPRSALRLLSRHSDHTLRAPVAAHDKTDGATLTQLAQDADPGVATEAISNHHLPVDYMQKIARAADINGRRILAHNESAPLGVLRTLSTTDDLTIQLGLAVHHRSDGSILDVLAGSTHVPVRARVAMRADTPPDILARLLVDDAAAVRLPASGNPNLPTHLRALCRMATK